MSNNQELTPEGVRRFLAQMEAAWAVPFRQPGIRARKRAERKRARLAYLDSLTYKPDPPDLQGDAGQDQAGNVCIHYAQR